MRLLPHLLITALLLGVLPAWAGLEAGPLHELKLSQLEQRLTDIDAELRQLAAISLRTGVGAVGYRSRTYRNPDHTEWVHIDLGEELLIDQIVLVPTIGRDSKEGLQADGFPVEFRLLAGTSHSTNVVASFTEEDNLLPRIAPLAVPFQPVRASWVRLECTLLSQRKWTGEHYTLMLAEIMVFCEGVNVAIQKPIQKSSAQGNSGGYHKRFLVDGFGPYVMVAAHGEESPARAFQIQSQQESPTLTIDLGASFPVNQISLHAIELNRSIPGPVIEGYAIPRWIRVSGANRPDFSDQALLFDYVRESFYDAGPVIRRNFPETRCRFVRMTAIEYESDNVLGRKTQRIGFAEIEILSNGQNIALDRPVTANSSILRTEKHIHRMTDGSNLYGEILPEQEWMNQLARRHDLEGERLQVKEALSLRFARQKVILHRISWLAALLLLISLTIVLVEKIARQRAIARTRKRIAANLHDELGANLHAIGLLGDFAKKIVDRKNAHDEWTELTDVIDEVRALTEETGNTARYCTNLLEAEEIHAHLIEEMKRTTDRLLTDLEHDATFPDESSLLHVHPRRRIDLYLFYKECLINILRHSHATRVSTQLTATPEAMSLIITDNGHGLAGNEVPESLRRRARLLGGSVAAESLAQGGTRITLQFRPRRRWWWGRGQKSEVGGRVSGVGREKYNES